MQRAKVARIGVLGAVLAGAGALCSGSSLAAFNGTPAAASMHAQALSTTKCLTVSLTDSSGNALSGGYVSLTVKSQGTSTVLTKPYGLTTGNYNLCYGGTTLPGALDISGFADTNGNRVQDTGEQTISGTA